MVLCLAYEGDDQLCGVPSHLQELINSYQLSPFITKVGLRLFYFILFLFLCFTLVNANVCLDYGLITNAFWSMCTELDFC